jgi:two-component system sensor histidine kinase CreC
MYVAAPVLRQGKLLGVVSVGKPVATLMPYADRARDRVLRAGFALLALSALIGLGFTLWLTRSINRLRDYALAVADGKSATPPTAGGRQLSELAASLALMRAKLEGKQYVEQYVQSLTHELKSPLTAIRGAAELLQEAGLPDDSRRFAGNIAEQSERMQLVIERLLALARIEQLEVPEERHEIVLRELIEQTVQSRDEQIAARRLSVHAGGDTGVAVRGDPFLLRQALGNLLDNAIAFSPEGGTVELAVATTADRVSIAVSDQGPGAPDYALPRLFERFYSLPRPATGRKSTGLGLAFVREVARVHGGAVTFANRPEGGAIATLTLLR